MVTIKSLFAVSVVLTLLAREALTAGQECMEIPTEVHIKMDDVQGTWYPMEIVLHRNDTKIYGVPLNTQCPVVTFSGGLKSKKTITMVWNATDGDMEYKFTQKGAKGQWQASGEQSGSLVNDGYKHYGGVVRVLKLHDGYMFLSFCSSKFRLLTTVAFSREENMPPDVLEETLGTLDSLQHKRAKEFHVRPCQEDTDGKSHQILSSCLLSIMTSLVVRFAH